ncbi:MAG TPA: aminotransferase class I/II-fold pyridoxal phosphate-dependent enzyme [Bacteroidetes bacterium]|nr:aminotransferase class I/II-fold pyridoxal phosphate-dependent enzyme [Bacteroidota bacterium]
MYGEESLAGLADLVANEDLYLIADEIYAKIVYDGKRFKSLAEFEAIRDRVLIISGVSKAYAMTGWRIGYALGPKSLVAEMGKIQSHTTSNPTSISQWAAIAALSGPQDCVEQMREKFRERRDRIYERLSGMPGVQPLRSQGAFYFFPDVSRLFGKRFGGQEIRNSVDLCQFLLDEQKVAIVPGSAFGSEQHVRISFATSLAVLEEAMDRIEAGLQKLDS